jgi:hypothetical protein
MNSAKPLSCIDRNTELEAARRELDTMLSGGISEHLIWFYHGVPMVGKTTLLAAIQQEAVQRGIATAQIDFDREQTTSGRIVDDEYDGEKGKSRIVEQLAEGLSRTSGRFFGLPSYDNSNLSHIVTVFIEHVKQIYRANQRCALVFDTVEDCTEKNFKWLQEEILVPLIDTNRLPTRVFFSSCSEPTNTFGGPQLIYPIRRRTKSIPIRSFSHTHTDQQIRAIIRIGAIMPPASEIIRFTGGLPGLNDAAIRWLAQHTLANENELLSYLVDHIIFERLVRRAVREVKSEMLTVSVLRQFNGELLFRVACHCWPEKYDVTDPKSIRPLLEKLRKTQLIESLDGSAANSVLYDLRTVLDGYWCRIKPKEHFEVHQIAAQWFAEQVAQGDFVAIANRLYHLAGMGYDLERSPALAQYLLPGLPQSPADPEGLIHELREALQALARQTNQRAFDRADKIKRIFDQPEFKLIVDDRTLRDLKQTCQAFVDRL